MGKLCTCPSGHSYWAAGDGSGGRDKCGSFITSCVGGKIESGACNEHIPEPFRRQKVLCGRMRSSKGRVKMECTNDMGCPNEKPPLYDRCVHNQCMMKYKRVVDVAMVTTGQHSSGYWENSCSHQSLSDRSKGLSGGYDTITVEGSEGDSEKWRNQVVEDKRAKVRLCVKYSSEPVDPSDEKTHGVCRLLLTTGNCDQEVNGLTFTGVRPIPRALSSSSSFLPVFVFSDWRSQGRVPCRSLPTRANAGAPSRVLSQPPAALGR